MATINVTDTDFETQVLQADKPVLVDFWAPWCGPCQLAGPVLEELSDEYADQVVVAKVNIDENPQSPGKYGVMSIPTVVLFNKGEEVDRKIGFAGKQGYVDLVKKSL